MAAPGLVGGRTAPRAATWGGCEPGDGHERRVEAGREQSEDAEPGHDRTGAVRMTPWWGAAGGSERRRRGSWRGRVPAGTDLGRAGDATSSPPRPASRPTTGRATDLHQPATGRGTGGARAAGGPESAPRGGRGRAGGGRSGPGAERERVEGQERGCEKSCVALLTGDTGTLIIVMTIAVADTYQAAAQHQETGRATRYQRLTRPVPQEVTG